MPEHGAGGDHTVPYLAARHRFSLRDIDLLAAWTTITSFMAALAEATSRRPGGEPEFDAPSRAYPLLDLVRRSVRLLGLNGAEPGRKGTLG
jgi:hypothetical protein